jgi:hypothetical protein
MKLTTTSTQKIVLFETLTKPLTSHAIGKPSFLSKNFGGKYVIISSKQIVPSKCRQYFPMRGKLFPEKNTGQLLPEAFGVRR